MVNPSVLVVRPWRTSPGDDCWDCSAILLGLAVPSGEPDAVQHTDRLPFCFYKIKEMRHD